MKKLVTLFFIFIFSMSLYAQSTDAAKPASVPMPDTVKHWKKGGVGTFNLSQVSLKNWAAGGESSVGMGVLFFLFTNYTYEKATWDNTLDVGYGLIQSGEAPFHKNDDKIDFATKFGYETINKWYFTVLGAFKTQFSPGYNYPNDSVRVSNFLAPAYILYSIGIDYKPNDVFTLYISPLTGKTTILNDQRLADEGDFGVDKAVLDTNGNIIKHGERHRFEFGAYLKTKFSLNLMENVTFNTKLDLFSNYLKNPQNIAVNWDVVLNLKVNKYIVTSVMTSLIYDNEVMLPIYQNINGVKTQTGTGPRTQFKEVLALGLSYNF